MANSGFFPRSVFRSAGETTSEAFASHFKELDKSEAMERLIHTHRVLEQASNELEEQRAANDVLARKLRETQEQVNAGKRAKAAFLSHMSHELRTPLNGVLGLAEMMQMKIYGPFGDARYESYLEDILKSSRYLLKHLDSMLEASRVELQETSMDIDKLAVRKTVACVLKDSFRQARQREIRLRTAIPRNLPDVWADAAWFAQILNCLLENAIKFAGKGTCVAITACREEHERIAISVSDQGPGMSQEEVEAALVLFGATDPMHARRNRGLGIGLSISKRLTEIQGGTLNVDTEPGEGTIVTVRLPLVDCEAPEGAA